MDKAKLLEKQLKAAYAERRASIRKRIKAGETMSAVARELKISRQRISQVCRQAAR